MHFKLITLTCILFLTTLTASVAQRLLPARQVDRLFENTGELYFSFRNDPALNISQITRTIAIDYLDAKTVKAFANRRQFEAFLELNIPYTILKRPAETADIQMMPAAETFGRTKLTTTYPTYTQFEELMAQFATDFPGICKLVNLGTLASGRKILALKISDNVNQREYEPQFLYTSSMHGDETAGYPMMLNLIEYLLTNYGNNQRVNRMVNNMEIWINPLANPDGTYRGGNNTVAQATRFNINNVDLNRNYPDPQDGQHPDGNPHQPETKIFMAWADTMDLVMAANLHGGIELVNYPWDTWASLSADLNWWRRQSLAYADTAKARSPQGYFETNIPGGDAPGVTNGFNWYEVAGGRQDYMNYWRHCREITLELSNTKLIPNNQIINHWNYNRASLLNFMEASLQGIKGIVRDSCTGQPIKARIFANNHDIDSSFVYTSLPVGNFHRPIAAGTWSITISANGYQSKTFNNIAVTDQGEVEMVTALSPLFPKAAAVVASAFSCEGRFDFKDISGSATSWNWNFGDGNTSAFQNPGHVYQQPGNYAVTLSTGNCRGVSALPASLQVRATVNQAPATQSDSAASCGAFSLNLSATAPGTIQWFANAMGGNSLFSGSSFTTPILRETKTYYAQSTIVGAAQNIGPATNIIGNGGHFTGNTYHNLIFDAYADFRLVAVTLYTNATGNKTIELRNAAGQLVQSAVVAARIGENRIILNFKVKQGTGWRLGTAGTSRLYRNISGANYPYAINGLVSINGNSAGDPNYYYYFYNWEVQSLCESERVPATAVSRNNLRLETNLTASETTVCQFDTIRIQAVSNIAGTQFRWLVNNNLNPLLNSSLVKLPANTPGLTILAAIVSSNENCLINPIDTTTTVNINVLTAPASPTISWQPPLLVSNIAQGMTWTKDGIFISGSLNQGNIVPDGPGLYAGYISDANICRSPLSNPIELLITELNQLLKQGTKLGIFPNPTPGKAWVIARRGGLFLIFNSMGQQIQQLNLEAGANTQSFGHLPNGIYLLKGEEGAGLRFEVAK